MKFSLSCPRSRYERSRALLTCHSAICEAIKVRQTSRTMSARWREPKTRRRRSASRSWDSSCLRPAPGSSASGRR
ncbi:MAG: hypothetical protein DMG08_21885 [Acidobacteria bacterium]|nr:MAG: hypothetical protein DMG08_21885 [Acidobacteriota bacterium]